MANSVPILDSFLQYLTVIKSRSPRTVQSYKGDISMFLRWLILDRDGITAPSPEELNEVDLTRATERLLQSVTRRDIMAFLAFTSTERSNQGSSRCRKLSALKTFFRYHATTERTLSDNPCANVDSPSKTRALPRFLNESESIELLKAVWSDYESKTRVRDYTILTLFLNCGMRLSELIAINLNDIDSDFRSLRVLGKGAKERIIYLNGACREALGLYLTARDAQGQVEHASRNALFLSSRNKRIHKRTVQWMVYKYLDLAGLSHKKCSVHKLRHTAATLMYRSGEVDIRVLKDILGHEQLSTTQIYTHVSDSDMERAMTQNPLAGIHPGTIPEKE